MFPSMSDAATPIPMENPNAEPVLGAAPDKVLSPAALRALSEAAERRRMEPVVAARTEDGGPGGPEPTRYGDWERKGMAVDF